MTKTQIRPICALPVSICAAYPHHNTISTISTTILSPPIEFSSLPLYPYSPNQVFFQSSFSDFPNYISLPSNTFSKMTPHILTFPFSPFSHSFSLFLPQHALTFESGLFYTYPGPIYHLLSLYPHIYL